MRNNHPHNCCCNTCFEKYCHEVYLDDIKKQNEFDDLDWGDTFTIGEFDGEISM